MLRLRLYALERRWAAALRLALLGAALAALRLLLFGNLTDFPWR